MKTIVQLVSELKDYLIEKDTAAKQAVESNIASVETDASSASKAYAVGQQLVLNDILYDVIDSIAIEDSLVVGTNIQVADKVSVAIAELASQNETLTNKAYLIDDTAITEVASDDLLPIYDTSATAKKKIAVSNFVGGLVSNPNLLDNSWFTVNQRGQSSYSTTGADYTFDRWYSYDGDTSVVQNADGSITLGAVEGVTKVVYLRQKIENTNKLLGKTVTISLLKDDNTIFTATGDVPSTVPSSQTGVAIAYIKENGVTIGTLSITFLANSYLTASIAAYVSASITIKAVKLELGSVSTLAMDTAPNYATELLKCQRYFVRFKNNKILCFTAYVQNTNARAIVFLPTAMRTLPTLTQSGTSEWILVDSSSAYLGTPVLASIDNQVITLAEDGIFPSTTNFEMGLLRLWSGTSIDFSADL